MSTVEIETASDFQDKFCVSSQMVSSQAPNNQELQSKWLIYATTFILLISTCISSISLNPVFTPRDLINNNFKAGLVDFSIDTFSYNGTVNNITAVGDSKSMMIKSFDLRTGELVSNLTSACTGFFNHLLMMDPLKLFTLQKTQMGQLGHYAYQTASGKVVAIKPIYMYNISTNCEKLAYTTNTSLIHTVHASDSFLFTSYDYSTNSIVRQTNYGNNTPIEVAINFYSFNSSFLFASISNSSLYFIDRITLTQLFNFGCSNPNISNILESVFNNLNYSQLVSTSVIGSTTSAGLPLGMAFLNMYDVSKRNTPGTDPVQLTTPAFLTTCTTSGNNIINFGPYQYVGAMPFIQSTGMALFIATKPLLDVVVRMPISGNYASPGSLSNSLMLDLTTFSIVFTDLVNQNLQVYNLSFDGCLYRDSTGLCHSCVSGFVVSSSVGCTSCGSGYFTQANACLQCDRNCFTCTGMSTNCTSCSSSFMLSSTNPATCQPLYTPSALSITSSVFTSTKFTVTVFFSASVAPVKQFDSSSVTAYLYSASSSSSSSIFSKLATFSAGTFLNELPPSVDSPQVTQIKISQNKVTMVLSFNPQTINDGTLVVNFGDFNVLADKSDPQNTYQPYYVVISNVTFSNTGLDNFLSQAQTGVGSTVAATSILLMFLSTAQAFILTKIFLTLDFYVYINTSLPANFVLFLSMITQNIFTLIPNLLNFLIVTDTSEERDNFNNNGVTVNIFNNLGSFFTVVFIALLARLLLSFCHFGWKKFRRIPHSNFFGKLEGSMGLEFFFSMFETNNQTIVLAILIAFTEVNNLTFSAANKVWFLLFVVLLSIFMIALYSVMFYTVRKKLKLIKSSQLSQESKQETPEQLDKQVAHQSALQAQPEVKKKEDEPDDELLLKLNRNSSSGPFSQPSSSSSEVQPVVKKPPPFKVEEHFSLFWEGKVLDGNFFQAYFSFIFLFRDILLAFFIYYLYYYPVVLMIMLMIVQTPFAYCVWKWRPYVNQTYNNQLIIVQFLYWIMDVFFLILVSLPQAEDLSIIYYGVGFPLIVCVCLMFGSSMYYGITSSYKFLKEVCGKPEETKEKEKGKDRDKSKEELTRDNSQKQELEMKSKSSSKKKTDPKTAKASESKKEHPQAKMHYEFEDDSKKKNKHIDDSKSFLKPKKDSSSSDDKLSGRQREAMDEDERKAAEDSIPKPRHFIQSKKRALQKPALIQPKITPQQPVPEKAAHNTGTKPK